MTFHDLRTACIPALLQHIDLKSAESFRKVLGKWSQLLSRLINNDEDQVDCLRIVFVRSMKSEEDFIIDSVL
jgi:hypothetical protein